MAFKPGYLGYFATDDAAASMTDISGYIDSVSVPQSADQLDVSVLGGTSAKQYIAGMTDGDSISVGGPYDATVHSHISGMKAAQAAGTVGFAYLYGPGGSVSGQAKVGGTVYLSNYTLSSSTGGRAEWTATFQVTGAVTSGTW